MYSLTETRDLQSDLKNLLDKAKQKGLEQAEVSAYFQNGFSVDARMGVLENVEHHSEKALSITVYKNKRVGTATTSDLSVASQLFTLEKACELARHTEEDSYSGLADASLMATVLPDLSLYHPWDITPEVAIQKALECETIARECDPRIKQSEGASVSTSAWRRVYANSHGFYGEYQGTEHGINCALIAEDNGHMQRDYEYTVSCDPTKLSSVEWVARETAKKTVSRLGAKKIKTQTCPVIFHSSVARSLLRTFLAAINGNNLYRGSSFLCNRLNQQTFPAWVTISQDPHLKGELGSAPFDGEGVLTRRLDYVHHGTLTNYVLDSYSARKLNLTTTGNAGGVHNLFMTTQDKSLRDLCREMNRGLLITEFMGEGVDLLTGNYSRGVFGYWIENGEILHPVEEVTVAGNLKDMFRQIVSVANDIDHRSSIKTGSILLEQITVGGD